MHTHTHTHTCHTLQTIGVDAVVRVEGVLLFLIHHHGHLVVLALAAAAKTHQLVHAVCVSMCINVCV
jgi:hypothetical protein